MGGPLRSVEKSSVDKGVTRRRRRETRSKANPAATSDDDERRGAIAETRASRTKGPKGGYRDIAQLCRGHKARISHLSSDRPNRSLYSGSLLLNMTICTGFIIVIPLSYFPLNQIPSLSFSSVFIEISPSSIQ